jgi:universal stress protein A
MNSFHKILVPFDFSDHSERAVQIAADLARHYQAPLTLFHVYEIVPYAAPEGHALYTPPPPVAGLLEEFGRRLEEVKARAIAAGAGEVDTLLREGFVAPQITELARDERFDLIVMGTHGRKGISHLLMGSVAEKVIRTAPCPVLTVRLPEPA